MQQLAGVSGSMTMRSSMCSQPAPAMSSRPSAVITRNLSRSFVGLPKNDSFSKNKLNPQTSLSKLPRMKTANRGSFTITTSHQGHTTPKPRWILTPSNEKYTDAKTHFKTQVSEKTYVSKELSTDTLTVQEKLLIENNRLLIENELLREQAEYLRTKYLQTLMKKYQGKPPSRKYN